METSQPKEYDTLEIANFMLGNYAKFSRDQNSESNKMRNNSTHKIDYGVRPIMPTSPGCCRPFTEKRNVHCVYKHSHSLTNP